MANNSIIHIPTNSQHENGKLKLISSQLRVGMYNCVACPLCKCAFSRRSFMCDCGQTSFPNLEIRYATANETCWIAYVVRCEECGNRSDSACDECNCGGIGISYVLYIPALPSNKKALTPPTPIGF